MAAGEDVQDRPAVHDFIPLYGCLWSMCAAPIPPTSRAVNAGRSTFESATAGSAICSTTTAPPIRALFGVAEFRARNSLWTRCPSPGSWQRKSAPPAARSRPWLQPIGRGVTDGVTLFVLASNPRKSNSGSGLRRSRYRPSGPARPQAGSSRAVSRCSGLEAKTKRVTPSSPPRPIG